MQLKVHLRGILFDMDGVLVDVSRSYRRAIEETVEHFTGRKILPGTIQRYKNNVGFSNDWKLTHAIITDTGMSIPISRVITEFQRRYRGENWDGFVSEEPSLISSNTLEELHALDYIMGIVTGRPDAEAQWTINRFGWKSYFPLVVAREKQEGREKPDAFPLKRALAILDAAGHRLKPETCLYVGDTIDDMIATRSAGMWAVGIVPPYVENQHELETLLFKNGAHVVIHNPGQLPELIRSFTDFLPVEPLENEI